MKIVERWYTKYVRSNNLLYALIIKHSINVFITIISFIFFLFWGIDSIYKYRANSWPHLIVATGFLGFVIPVFKVYTDYLGMKRRHYLAELKREMIRAHKKAAHTIEMIKERESKQYGVRVNLPR